MINREDIKEYYQYFVKQCETNNVPTDFPFFESFSHFSSSVSVFVAFHPEYIKDDYTDRELLQHRGFRPILSASPAVL